MGNFFEFIYSIPVKYFVGIHLILITSPILLEYSSVRKFLKNEIK